MMGTESTNITGQQIRAALELLTAAVDKGFEVPGYLVESIAKGLIRR